MALSTLSGFVCTLRRQRVLGVVWTLENHELNLRQLIGTDSLKTQVLQGEWEMVILKPAPSVLVPLQDSSTGCGGGGWVALSSAIALVQVWRTDVADRGRREFFRGLIWPAKLLLSLAINFYSIDHGDTCWIHRGPNCNKQEKLLRSTFSEGLTPPSSKQRPE